MPLAANWSRALDVCGNPTPRRRTARGADEPGVALDADKQRQLLAYLALLIKWNKAYNLTAVRDPDEMVSRHLLDSLSIVPYAEAGDNWLDVGSGGGMPGVPLAILFPEKRLTLLDSNGKKTRFLTQVKLELKLANLEVVHSRVEAFRPERAPSMASFPRFQQPGGLRQLDPPPRWPGNPLAGDEGRASERRAGGTPGGFPGRSRARAGGTRLPRSAASADTAAHSMRGTGITMAKVFAIANQKGGVGKTTTCINLAASLVATKRRVLLLDLDPQGNATTGSGIDKHNLEHSIYDVLTGECNLAEAMQFSEHGGYQLLPANRDLTAAEVVLLEMDMKENRLRNALAPIRENYDYILIDCPPSLSMLTVNALTAADGVIIPMQCEYYALEGLTDLMNSIQRIGQLLNPTLKIEGLLRTMYDPRISLTNDVSAQLQEHFGDTLYSTVIPRNVRLAEAPSFGMPALVYDKQSRGAIAYLALAGELVRRQRAKGRAATA